nr:uncharacterized protein LOC778851 isoform X1 [Ciona intestinalis]XP_026691947.1 uncharacterized protein LOC778851 isoform X1 [Ciona intestinalis]|eukprot:XP_026691946.1 uncharacterized protein LOC778851 isoform X1 [Ciona intestinalis]
MEGNDPTVGINTEAAKPGNKTCAECYARDPQFASLTFGVFICGECSRFHRELSNGPNKVVEISKHQWSNDEVTFFNAQGNGNVNSEFEKELPIFYHRPDKDDPTIIREQWIRAKYEREEFKLTSQQSSYNQGSKTGALFKRGKDNGRYHRRKFILKEPEGVLKYFIRYSDKTPKDVIPIKDLVSIYVVPGKMGNENGMQLTYEKNGTRRNIYVYGEDGKTTSDWYHAIRASMVKHKYENFPVNEAQRYLNIKMIKEGWMSKTGPKAKEKFRQRWFSLVGTLIWYYNEPLDPHPIGFIPLGSKTFGYGIMKGLPLRITVEGCGITVHTPDRVYALICSDIKSRDEWYTAIDQVLESCTNMWVQPGIGRLGSEKTLLEPAAQKPNENENAASENLQSRTSPISKEVDSSPDMKESKTKTSKIKRERSIPSSPEVTIKHESPKRVLRTHDSKLYSDDSGDDTAIRCKFQLQSISDNDSEEDVVVVVQPDRIEPKTTPKKPPRKHLKQNTSNEFLATISNQTSSQENLTLEVSSDDQSGSYSFQPEPDSLSPLANEDWRKKTFSSFRRVAGNERKSVKQRQGSVARRSSLTSIASTLTSMESKEICKPVDITLVNQMDESLWFMVFQSEVDHEHLDSYVTPWIGAQIAEAPASVGPIRIPCDFEIAIIDTAPGGFNLQRTTGPFYAEPGDVWEVEIPNDDGSAPEMFFHEGMETEDGSVMVYSNIDNVKRFDVAVFKSKRKLFTRTGVKPGDSVPIKIQPALHFMAVDSETYYNLENQELRSVDYIPKASIVKFNYRTTKLKVVAKKRGKTVYFTCEKPKSLRNQNIK